MLQRHRVGAVVAEFLGTATLALVAMGSVKYFNFTAPWYVGLAVGVTLAALVGIIGKASGAHLNPAITMGLLTLRRISLIKSVAYITAQLFGGITAFMLIEYMTNSDITSAGSSTLDIRIFVAETLGMAIFAFGFASVVMQKIEGMQAAFTIGASLFMGVLVASIVAPGFINPAVALANNAWDKTTVLAPLVGSIIGMNVYSFFLAPERSLLTPKSKNNNSKK